MISGTLNSSQSTQKPELAEKLVFRSTRDQKMKGPLTLAACLDSLAAERLASELALRRGHSITVNAGQVTFVGALALQLLIATRRQWNTDGKLFEIAEPSEEFLEGISSLGCCPTELGLEGPAEVAP